MFDRVQYMPLEKKILHETEVFRNLIGLFNVPSTF